MLGLFGSARRQVVARAWVRTLPVPSASGVVVTLPRLGLLAPVNYAKTGGSANLSVNALSGAISAAVAIGEGASQTISGTATGADGVVIPWSATLAGASPPGALDFSLPANSGLLALLFDD